MAAPASIPDKIQALVNVENDAHLKTIDFGCTELVQKLDPEAIIVRVRAVGLNPTDWFHAFGVVGLPGRVSGCDAAGGVVKLGSSVTHLQVGDRVAAFNTYGGSHPNNGAYAEYVRLDSALTFKLPDDMSYEEAASFPIPHYTAFQTLYLRFNLPHPLSSQFSAETILIWGGSTATGYHAIQLARLSGLRVLATASPAAHAYLKALGADEVFDYKDPDVVSKIKDAAGLPGVSLAIDAAIQDGSTEKIIDIIGPSGGKVVPLRPVSEEISNRRSDVYVDTPFAYTLGGHEFTFAGTRHFDPIPSDREGIKSYVTKVLPLLLDGWKKDLGSPKFKTQTLRKIEGRSWPEVKGLRIMQNGEYGREKLVVSMD